MKRFGFLGCLLAALAVGLCCSWQASALTIFRIGGESLPRPEIEGDFDFVQLSWSEAEEARHGSMELLDVDPDFIVPRQLDPSVNLTPLLEGNGGQILALGWTGWEKRQKEDLVFFDEDPNTAYLGDGHFAAHAPPQKHMIFDFGGRFLIQRIRFFPRERFENERFVQKFVIGISDGDPLKDGTRDREFGTRGHFLNFDVAHEITENTEAIIDLPMPPVPIKQILFQGFENTRGIWEIAEFQIFGVGFAPFAHYVSNVIDLGEPASLGQLTWLGQKGEDAHIDLSMRSGDDDDPNNYWRFTFRGDERTRFGVNGRPLQLATYKRLESGEKAGITHDTENWEFWSTPYDFEPLAGDLLGSKPRQFVQFKADFASNLESSGRLDYLQFAVAIPPLASEALAEIAPNRAPAGEVTSFTYKIKPNLEGADLGFDSITIDTPARPASIDEVRVGGLVADFEVTSVDETGFTIRIPHVDIQQTEELIEVDFQAEVFKYGTVFSGRVFNSVMAEEVHQSLTPGNADDLFDGDALRVDLVGLDSKTIQSMQLSSPVLTPNGDGINDVLVIEYDLLNLVGDVPATVEVYNLSGRKLGAVPTAVVESGRFTTEWNGRDEEGNVLPPGMYILRLQIEADRGPDSVERIVSLVY
ncbi:MAG: hypothetical protein HOL51_18450 [Gemmatimonadetes bacterium]|jgi:hypothetical protein|nr:hypothetical protein [Gemmatimonadota bacterium]MBT5328095.1 hypothetical protein [Gemmatimonadota bacterium]MBT5452506.1 hypothetical protein [Gemmatimonadota bacterium]MBT5800966.1 hypothetical protein [Gemmatimonadota bacterium]MBT6619400.1 hypothetical protein [Gemmatimonadota bacterium]